MIIAISFDNIRGMAITIDWVPGFDRRPHNSYVGEYTGGPVKLVLHTFEGYYGNMEGAVALMMGRNTGIYHILVDLETRWIVQLMPLNAACSALVHPDNVETNKDSAIQVCILGKAENMPAATEEQLKWLGEAVFATLKTYVNDINLDNISFFYGQDCGWTLASVDAPQRFTSEQWDNFSGVCGHQHVFGNDHWDPGGLNVIRAVNYAKTKLENQGSVIGVGAPLGNIDVVTDVGNGKVRIAGWGFDPSRPGDSIDVHLYINGMLAAGVRADKEREDINTFFNIPGNHGFDAIVSIPIKITVDAYGISDTNSLLKRIEAQVTT